VKTIVLIGGGKLVYFLTRMFISKGYAVTIINNDREESTLLARRVRATVVFGDGSDPRVLGDAEASSADILLAVTPYDHTNLVICQIASLRFQVPRVLALVSDPNNEELFGRLGVTAFSPTKIIASLIEQRAEFEEITNLIPVGESKIMVTEILLSETAKACGKPLRDLSLPESSLVGYILRDGRPLVPRGDTVLMSGDRLILIALPENYGRVLSVFTETA
jgi:trk system potassium uptake protein TrkA